jgi:hypothetical protein
MNNLKTTIKGQILSVAEDSIRNLATFMLVDTTEPEGQG